MTSIPATLRIRSEGALRSRAARGDTAAYAAVYERHHQALYRYCRSILRHDEDAQDALQSTMARAFAAETLLAGRRHVAPQREVVGQILDLRTIAGRRLVGPLGDHAHPAFFFVGQCRFGFLQALEPVETQVVAAAFHVGRADLAAHRVGERRQVFVEDLVLQRARARGDEHAAADIECRRASQRGVPALDAWHARPHG